MADALIPGTQLPIIPTGLGAAVVAVVSLIIREFRPWRKMTLDANQQLIETLGRRVDKLERQIEEKDAKHEAEVALLRHQLVGSDQCLEILLTMLEQVTDLPDRAREAVVATKRMRAEKKDRQATESATYRATMVARARSVDEGKDP